MFNSKQKQLFKIEGKQTSGSNAFLEAGLKKSAETLSGNMAKKYSTTGNEFVDQFGKLGSYKKPRTFQKISKDISTLWAIDPEKTLKFTIYMRIVTRKVNLFDGSCTKTVQRGAGLKYEAIMRMMWIAIFHPDAFWNNLATFIAAGSWKDIILMLRYDLVYNGWKERQLDWNKFRALIKAGLENSTNCELLKKYLPRVKAKNKNKCKTIEAQANTMIGKWIASFLELSYKDYRKLKSSGTGHTWQQLISKKDFLNIDFNTIHGRALSQLVSGKFLANQDLEEKYEKWIISKPVAKFTGYVHELFQGLTTGKYYHRKRYLKSYQIHTLNKQFKGLLEVGKTNATCQSGLIVVRDTSSSMGSKATGTTQTCFEIGKALALYFSEFLEGHFSNSWIEFKDDAKLHTWKGSTPYEKYMNDEAAAIGNTNFMSVINLLCNIKMQGIPEADFPKGILCISDAEFDPTTLNMTNVAAALIKLKDYGFSGEYISNFQIILWNLQSAYYGKGTGEKFETHGGTKNVFYFSGYDASVIAFLTGTEIQKTVPKTDVELFEAAIDQELLSTVGL